MNRPLIIVMLVALLAGCTGTLNTPYTPLALTDYQPVVTKKSEPPVNEVRTQAIGEQLVSYNKSNEYDVLNVDNSTIYVACPVKSPKATKVKVSPQVIYPAGNNAQTGKLVYYPVYELGMPTADGGWVFTDASSAAFLIGNSKLDISQAPGSLTVYEELDSSFSIKFRHCAVQSFTNVFNKGKDVLEGDYYFTQELIYNGRVDDNLKFIYREYTDRMARSAFTQEAQYDLKTSNIIAFKTMKLEIIEATNQHITYKVLSHFDGVM